MRPLRKSFIEKDRDEDFKVIDYEKLYKVLFNGITDAISDMDQQNYDSAKFALIVAQQKAEDLFVESDDAC